MTNINNIILEEIIKKSLEIKVEEVSPSFKKKNTLSCEQIEKIIQTISFNLNIEPEKALIGIYLLFLQGAASAGAPLNMSVDLGNGKYIEKKNIVNACNLVTEHTYIRRIAETLAKEIGDFAYKKRLVGELAYRVNNKFKAETGNSLTGLEIAYCSIFSQVIPDLSEITSDRLARLLAEDYQKRFELKKKPISNPIQATGKKSKKSKKRK